MLFVSGKSQHTKLTFKVYDFFRELYDVKSDVEVFYTNLTDDNAFGFTEENGDEQFIQIHNDLSEKDFTITLLHELVHVFQNEWGVNDEIEREDEAYALEGILYNQYLQSVRFQSYSAPDCINSMNNTQTMTFCAPQYKVEYLTECLLEVVNNQWKVNAIESGYSSYSKLEYSVGKKYIKLNQFRVHADGSFNNNGVFMFVDKNTGECYKPASYKAPAKGVRYLITQLVDNSEVVDPYGSFLYL